MPRQYPPLTPQEVVRILLANGFTLTGTEGSHAHYERGSNKVTVDMAKTDFCVFLMQSMIRQSGLSRVKFYCSTKATAKKINKRFRKDLGDADSLAPAEA